MENEGTNIVPFGGDADDLMQVAAHAEARIDAVMKIKKVALKVTNAMDWVDQRDKPYLMASGSEKIANLFNISWRLLSPEPAVELESDGNYTFTYSGEFSMGNRTIQCEGSRSSRDKFFTQYDKARNEKLVSDRDNRRDVKMAAFTNLLGNGITRILGIRNMTYADLLEFAGIKQSELQKVVYKTSDKEGVKPAPVKDAKPADNAATAQPTAEGKPAGELDVFDTLEKELAEFCDGNDDAMQEKLAALTSFPQTDKETKKPTGKMVEGKRFVSDLRMKGKTAWAGSALKKLREEVAGER
jgi:hypothetical protein